MGQRRPVADDLKKNVDEKNKGQAAPPFVLGNERPEKGSEQGGVCQFRPSGKCLIEYPKPCLAHRPAPLFTFLVMLFLVSHAAMLAVMLYALQRQMRKQCMTLHRRELCYISLVPQRKKHC